STRSRLDSYPVGRESRMSGRELVAIDGGGVLHLSYVRDPSHRQAVDIGRHIGHLAVHDGNGPSRRGDGGGGEGTGGDRVAWLGDDCQPTQVEIDVDVFPVFVGSSG